MQPLLPSRVSAALSRYRMGGRRSRAARRAVSIVLLLAAGALALTPADAANGTAVLTVVRDLPVGTVLAAGDLRAAMVTDPPDGALGADSARATVGQVLASPVRRGETLTDARLLSDQGPDPGAGRVALPITTGDAAVRALLRPGMHITLVRVTSGFDDRAEVRASPLTSEAVVLAVAAEASGQRSATVIVSVPAAVASAVTAASVADALLVQFGP